MDWIDITVITLTVAYIGHFLFTELTSRKSS